jgi:hypothetical protein
VKFGVEIGNVRSIRPTLFPTTAMGAAITIKDVAVDVDLVVFVGAPDTHSGTPLNPV